MMTASTHSKTEALLILQTGKLVAAYVMRNATPAAQLPALIERVHSAVASLRSGQPMALTKASPMPTAAEIQASIQNDGIVSFIDGKSYQTLKRHLTAHGLSPERYRAHYGLPAKYPMVAPGYSARRAALARHLQHG